MKTLIILTLTLITCSSCLKEYTCSCKKSDNAFPELNKTEEFKIKAIKSNKESKCATNERSEETFTIRCEVL